MRPWSRRPDIGVRCVLCDYSKQRTLPRQMSSTSCGSMLLLRTTCSRILKTRPSRGVSLKPPLTALVRGVLMARVMTTSSGFWEVLLEACCQPKTNGFHVIQCDVDLGKEVGRVWRGAYICSSGDLPGVMWERTLERRWVAIVRVVCVECEDGETVDGKSVVGILSRLQRRRQIVSLGSFGHNDVKRSSAGSKRASALARSPLLLLLRRRLRGHPSRLRYHIQHILVRWS